MKNINYRALPVKVVLFALVILLGSFLGNHLSGDVWQNSKCKTATTPVTTCDCPLGPNHNDRCKGTLPKIGNMHGGVTCQGEYNSTCDYGNGEQNKNECGIVVMCSCVTCGTPLIMGCPNPCTEFPLKTPCTNSWGECTYTP